MLKYVVCTPPIYVIAPLLPTAVAINCESMQTMTWDSICFGASTSIWFVLLQQRWNHLSFECNNLHYRQECVQSNIAIDHSIMRGLFEAIGSHHTGNFESMKHMWEGHACSICSAHSTCTNLNIAYLYKNHINRESIHIHTTSTWGSICSPLNVVTPENMSM